MTTDTSDLLRRLVEWSKVQDGVGRDVSAKLTREAAIKIRELLNAVIECDYKLAELGMDNEIKIRELEARIEKLKGQLALTRQLLGAAQTTGTPYALKKQ